MSYTEDILHLRKSGSNYRNESTKWLFGKIKQPDANFMKVGLNNLKVGSFYFMQYDLKKINKSSKVEQFVPMLVVDYKPSIDSKVIWVLNMNFLPTNVKEALFSNITDNYSDIFDKNTNVNSWSQEIPLVINYKKMWDILLPYGFEYAIREIRVDLINSLWSVSSKNLHILTTVNTQILTGVDEGKLQEIWATKLKNESLGNRVDELKTIKTNYYNILEELADKFKNLNKYLNEI